MNLYENTKYNNSRITKQAVTIEVIDSGLKNDDILNYQKVNLSEPLKLDTVTDVYIESVICNTHVGSGIHLPGQIMVIKIDELDIRNKMGLMLGGTANPLYNAKANNTLSNAIFIPHTAVHILAGDDLTINKPYKSNYVSTLNPATITELNVKVGLLKDINILENHGGELVSFTEGTIFHGTIWITLMFVSREKTT